MGEQIVCDVCGILVDSNKYERHKKFGHKEKIKKDFLCELCKKTFTSMPTTLGISGYLNNCSIFISGLYNLQYHMAHHINARSFLCNECPRAYNTAADLAQHQRMHDKGRDPFKCEECGMLFQIRSKFNTHIRIHRTESKEPKECHICRKSFICLSSHNRIVHMNLRSYACKFCDKKFGKKSGLDRHVLTVHEQQRNFKCELCMKDFGEKAQLKKHKRVHSLIKEITYCPKCRKNFKNIRQHYEEKHSNLKHICQSCFKRFKNLRDLEIHFKTKHSTFRSYFCDYCSKGFAEKFQIERHVKLHTKIISSNKNIKEEFEYFGIEKVYVDELDLEIKTKEDIQFDQLEERARNFVNHENIFKNDLMRFDSMGVDLRIQYQKDFSITCDKCDEKFFTKHEVQQHIQFKHLTVNSQRELIACFGCDNKYDSKVEMQEHFNETHDTLNGFHCTFCNKMFGKVKLLKIHHQANHTSIKFECKDCKRNFNYKSALDRHYKRKHLNERNHICNECQRQFGTKFELDQHVEGHHRNLTIENRTCNFCNKTFINERNLDIHLQAIHSNSKHECEICQKLFSFKSAKDRHLNVVHLHQKLHECEDCKKTFGTKYDLKNHFNRFHNENPFEIKRFGCHQCNKDFVTSSALSRHRKGVHENIKQKAPKDYRCKICHEHLNNKYQKEKHFTQVHLNGNKLKRTCGYCKMDFQLYENFKNHINLHAGIFICITCGDPFSALEILNQHVESHKKIELRLKRFICDLCGHRLFNKIQLNIHMRKHVQHKTFYVC
ncbi:unnamed protein product [Chironomus riparius]|uniref:C2H2-type domain-containing protein n=1 Tax=Chironomus riparius TaxID=315576 RepID=A0A9P0NBW1_9DIPT|nr:unnamed protein product [Chironomus riparius]